jgi:acid phosphatase class B
MPVIKCTNGKWRIGSGLCQYETKEKAQEVYVAIISSGSLAADGNKVSFDFDDTLSTKRGQDIAKRLISEGKTVYIVTRRQETASEEVYKIADELGIPKSRVHFTNGELKWKTIKRLGIDTHYDNNENEVNKIRENTDAKAIKF